MHWEVMREAPWCIFLTNQQGYDVPIEQLTNAWHHPTNLGNLLSYRKLENRTGLNLSSFIKTWDTYAPNFFSRGGRLWRPAFCSKNIMILHCQWFPQFARGKLSQTGSFFNRKAFTPFSFWNPVFSFYCYNLLPREDLGLICCIDIPKTQCSIHWASLIVTPSEFVLLPETLADLLQQNLRRERLKQPPTVRSLAGNK
jgi:hypothetical protein